MEPDRWTSDIRRTTIRDLLVIVALASLPLAVAGITARSDRAWGQKALIVGVALVIPTLIALTWYAYDLARPRQRWRSDVFVLIYIGLTFLSIVSVVVVFMLDRPMAGLLGLSLFGLLSYLANGA
jgi:F0F1-type ATP synthase assembly protein I